jgi:hypothetical protein
MGTYYISGFEVFMDYSNTVAVKARSEGLHIWNYIEAY